MRELPLKLEIVLPFRFFPHANLSRMDEISKPFCEEIKKNQNDQVQF